eukprot:11184656-Lingulodinium_polyedra.AAC.1
MVSVGWQWRWCVAAHCCLPARWRARAPLAALVATHTRASARARERALERRLHEAARPLHAQAKSLQRFSH